MAASELLTRHETDSGAVWAYGGRRLAEGLTLSNILDVHRSEIVAHLRTTDEGVGKVLAPVDPVYEVWASGVTYLRSRQEREAESSVADVYARVYEAERPEIFFKANGGRVVGDRQPIRIRRDSHWNVPEPELTLVINRFGEIVGYTAGNDVSSRSIEGDNPLYLPQAKCYDGSCALGPGIVLCHEGALVDLPIRLEIVREGSSAFAGETSTGAMHRSFQELVGYLFREMSFPHGAFLMTGTGIVPEFPFTLEPGDEVQIDVGELRLTNVVARNA